MALAGRLAGEGVVMLSILQFSTMTSSHSPWENVEQHWSISPG